MARLVRTKWELEECVLRPTHVAILTSLVTYGRVTICSPAYLRGFRRLGTLDNNMSARRITGASRSARLQVLHAAVGIRSGGNLYLQLAARFLARVLSAVVCLLTTRNANTLAQEYKALECLERVLERWQPQGLMLRTTASRIMGEDL